MKTKKKTIFYVEHNDLDQAVNSFLKKQFNKNNINSFSVVADQDVHNATTLIFTVEDNAEQDDEFFLLCKADIEDGYYNFDTDEILNWMCREGEIDAGEYVINIC